MDHKKLKDITTFIFDVDGVFTDGTILVTETGELLRRMNVRDGQAIKMALSRGYHIALITKGNSRGVRYRFAGLGIEHIHDNVTDKRGAFEDIAQKLSLQKQEIIYMGDDLPDLAVADLAGVFACPANAVPEVLEEAEYISPYDGGHTCVREIIERVMKVQDQWKTS